MGLSADTVAWLHFLMNVFTAVAGHKKPLSLAYVNIRKVDLVV